MKLRCKIYEDWYKISTEDIIKHGGVGLLKIYSGSLTKLLASIFPSVDWKLWQFNKVPNGFWNELVNQKKFVDWLGIQDLIFL